MYLSRDVFATFNPVLLLCLKKVLYWAKNYKDIFIPFSRFEDVVLSEFRALSEQKPIADDYSGFK